jgi:sugar fermentation stimulation protein A
MQYKNIVEARFIERPNRFIAYCEVEGERVKTHIRNTGRLKELLFRGVKVYLEKSSNGKRRTGYSLITVEKGQEIGCIGEQSAELTTKVNIDSTAPNKVVKEALADGKLTLLGLEQLTLIKPESTFGESRFDFYLEAGDKKAFVEVKGVTLEENGTALFPDAPTERGLRHVEELIKAKTEGYEAYIVFIVQMTGVSFFSPNNRMHPDFGMALNKAERKGVKILCYDCEVTCDSITLKNPVPVKLP